MSVSGTATSAVTGSWRAGTFRARALIVCDSVGLEDRSPASEERLSIQAAEPEETPFLDDGPDDPPAVPSALSTITPTLTTLLASPSNSLCAISSGHSFTHPSVLSLLRDSLALLALLLVVFEADFVSMVFEADFVSMVFLHPVGFFCPLPCSMSTTPTGPQCSKEITQ